MSSGVLNQVFDQGLNSARPAAAAGNAGYYWLSTDVNGGTLYQSTGSAWVQLAASVAAVAPTGLTGATAASRYAGATASGAPVSGTFAVGDFVIDQTGKMWVCTSSGSPGTWVQVGAGSAGAVTLLDTQTLSIATAAITVPHTGTIAGTYKDLRIVLVGASTQSGTSAAIVTAQINADSGSNYSWQRTNSSVSSVNGTLSTAQTSFRMGAISEAGAPSNYASAIEIDIRQYANTNWFKAIRSHATMPFASGDFEAEWEDGLWLSTAAITSLVLSLSAGNFAANTTCNLYGIS